MRYKKINKTQARKLYFNGCPIMLLPCKININNALSDKGWVKPITISFIPETSYLDYNTSQFDFKVSDYEYFNCNTETGRYVCYYVSEEDLENQKMCDMMCS